MQGRFGAVSSLLTTGTNSLGVFWLPQINVQARGTSLKPSGRDMSRAKWSSSNQKRGVWQTGNSEQGESLEGSLRV